MVDSIKPRMPFIYFIFLLHDMHGNSSQLEGGLLQLLESLHD